MGVKLLSSLLKNYCSNAVNKIHLSKLSGKKICIDTSIYLYRYKSQECLVEKFYLMCSLFRYYDIIPIFIFDGKPPIEKHDVLLNRREKRKQAELYYAKLMSDFGSEPSRHQEEILTKLKRTFTRITKIDIENIKNLFDAYGIKYINAIGEADVLCASLVLKKRVYAVLTEDMDLFAYGCGKVLRYFSLAQHNCLIYDLDKILEKLSINLEDFQTLCILSGTDYYSSKKNIFYYLKLYNKYKKYKINYGCFLDWLDKYKYLNNEINKKLPQILNIYRNIEKEINNYTYRPIIFGNINKKELYNILEKDRFIIC